jgi:hypothetical protein
VGEPARELLGHRARCDTLASRRGAVAFEQLPSHGFHAGRRLPWRLPALFLHSLPYLPSPCPKSSFRQRAALDSSLPFRSGKGRGEGSDLEFMDAKRVSVSGTICATTPSA